MLLADTHVHIYTNYSLASALKSAFLSLKQSELKVSARLAQNRELQLGLFLAERQGCTFFSDLVNARLSLPAGYEIEDRSTQALDLLEISTGTKLTLVAGRQLATKERLEVLALGQDLELPDGLPLFETIRRVLDLGAAPIIPWALGKWWFARGRLVSSAISEFQKDIFLADSAMRPYFFPIPQQFPLAARLSVPIIAGSDPLPKANEESWIGRYLTLFEDSLSTNFTSSELLQVLRHPKQLVGERRRLLQIL